MTAAGTAPLSDLVTQLNQAQKELFVKTRATINSMDTGQSRVKQGQHASIVEVSSRESDMYECQTKL
jgi:hypothetical protein